ncbi:MAG: hypothetical protein JWM92_97 [Candidatus Nomurabacteria bacterium]|jgi:hypothetical protein|nr:hypothetical protein [Candidatus Nomurabacteria bacterium]
MTVATRKILLCGLLGMVYAGAITSTGFAAEQQPAWVQKMSAPLLHETVGKAIESDDYNAFANAIKGKPGAQAITHTQFDALVHAYKLHENGSDTAAQQILQQAGIQAPHN